MRPHTPGTRAPAPQTSQGPDTPWRPTCGSGQSPDAARAPSRHFTQEKREARSCNSKSGRPVAATVTHEAGEKVSQKIVLHPPAPPSSTPPYVWRISHAKWNLLRRIEHGNTTTSAVPRVANALRKGHKIAVWWQETDPAKTSRWYTAKVVDTTVERGTQHTVIYDSDKSQNHTHEFVLCAHRKAHGDYKRWAPAPPTYTPPCPKCGGTTRGATGASTGRLSYTCDRCGSRSTCRNPATLVRADPTCPRITEDPDVRLSQPRAARPPPAPQARGTRQSPRLAALAADAGGQAAADAQMENAGAQAQPAPRRLAPSCIGATRIKGRA